MTRKRRTTVPDVQEGELSLGSGLDEVGWIPRSKRDGQCIPSVGAVDTRPLSVSIRRREAQRRRTK